MDGEDPRDSPLPDRELSRVAVGVHLKGASESSVRCSSVLSSVRRGHKAYTALVVVEVGIMCHL